MTKQQQQEEELSIIGQRRGKLVAIETLHVDTSGNRHILCQCDCGKTEDCFQWAFNNGKILICKDCKRIEKEKKINLKGQKFGKLLVVSDRLSKDELTSRIESHPKTNLKLIYFKCLYDCGNEFIKSRDTLLRGTALSCGCAKRNEDRKWAIEHYLYTSCIKSRCHQRDMEYNLPFEKYRELIHQPCYYCQRSDSLTRYDTYRAKKKTFNLDYSISYNGIDRVDPSKGYIEGNCVPCCKFCNTMKMDFSLEFFKDQIIKIYNNFIIPSIEFPGSEPPL